MKQRMQIGFEGVCGHCEADQPLDGSRLGGTDCDDGGDNGIRSKETTNSPGVHMGMSIIFYIWCAVEAVPVRGSPFDLKITKRTSRSPPFDLKLRTPRATRSRALC